jgi:hypothetical protein
VVTGFAVDVGQLHDVGRILSEVSAVLSAGTLLSDQALPIDQALSMGNARVEAAVARFDGRWRRSVGELAEAVERAARLVSEAARRYGNVEAQLVSAMWGPE